jgi:hypothetical protein
MATKTTFKFNGKAFGKAIYNRIAEEQTARLIAYAEEELVRIVESKKCDDRTYNLSDSYFWCVFFQGKRKGFGTYGRKKARKNSLLHEYTPMISVKVNGRALANEFGKSYEPQERQGWEIVFGAVAPYGAYLEEGFMFHGKRYQFDVMSQRYDHIKNALSPLCKVTLEIHTPKY